MTIQKGKATLTYNDNDMNTVQTLNVVTKTEGNYIEVLVNVESKVTNIVDPMTNELTLYEYLVENEYKTYCHKTVDQVLNLYKIGGDTVAWVEALATI